MAAVSATVDEFFHNLQTLGLGDNGRLLHLLMSGHLLHVLATGSVITEMP